MIGKDNRQQRKTGLLPILLFSSVGDAKSPLRKVCLIKMDAFQSKIKKPEEKFTLVKGMEGTYGKECLLKGTYGEMNY